MSPSVARRRALFTLGVAVAVVLAFVVGYLLGQGPKWVLWEIRGCDVVVRATTEFFVTRWGCTKLRDEWNEREANKQKQEEEEWRRQNPEPPPGLGRVPFIIHVKYEYFPVGVTPGVHLTPLFR